MLKYVTHTGIGISRCSIGGGVEDFERVSRVFLVVLVVLADVEMLHRQPPLCTLSLDTRNDSTSACTSGNELSCCLKVADSCRKAYSARIYARKRCETFYETERLTAAVTAHK